MKQLKRCDGYVLPYVLVVFLILSAVAVSICAVSLNNLQAQEAAVKRATALYKAEGEIEKVKVRMETYSNEVEGSISDALDDYWMAVKEEAKAKDETEVEVTVSPEKINSSAFEAILKINHKGVQIDSKVTVTLTVDSETRTEKNDQGQVISSTTYSAVQSAEVKYASYNISYEEGGAG